MTHKSTRDGWDRFFSFRKILHFRDPFYDPDRANSAIHHLFGEKLDAIYNPLLLSAWKGSNWVEMKSILRCGSSF